VWCLRCQWMGRFSSFKLCTNRCHTQVVPVLTFASVRAILNGVCRADSRSTFSKQCAVWSNWITRRHDVRVHCFGSVMDEHIAYNLYLVPEARKQVRGITRGVLVLTLELVVTFTHCFQAFIFLTSLSSCLVISVFRHGLLLCLDINRRWWSKL
jgi:hypothetical protein